MEKHILAKIKLVAYFSCALVVIKRVIKMADTSNLTMYQQFL